MNPETIAAALRQELAGYERRGMNDRAAQVRHELARLGYSAGDTPPDVVQPKAGEPAPAKPTPKRKAAKK